MAAMMLHFLFILSEVIYN